MTTDHSVRWVDVTPMVFIMNAGLGWAAMAMPVLVGAWGPRWLVDVGIGSVLLPPAIGLLGWSAFAYRAGAFGRAARIGGLAFCAAASWPFGSIGVVVAGFSLLSAMRWAPLGEGGEVMGFLLFLLGGVVAAIACWRLSRIIAHTIWPHRRRTEGAAER